MATTKRPPPKKRPALAVRKLRATVNPVLLAVSGVERIRTALIRAGHKDWIGEPVTPEELVLRGNLLGQALPPSYVVAVRLMSRIGEPDLLLTAWDMADALEEIATEDADVETRGVLPFARTAEGLYCFEKQDRTEGELAVVEWVHGLTRPRHRNFGEWLDSVADEREEALKAAVDISPRLRALLVDLGFQFDYPVVGRLETADVAALDELLGPEASREVRGGTDRLFDSSGKASLALNMDAFTLECTLRTGTVTFEAEEVFRWLRCFRDENFFGDSHRAPAHPDTTRDLRKAQRKAPLVTRGVREVETLGARIHTFRAASGSSSDDFYLLGRAGPASNRMPSLILHIKKRNVHAAHAVDEPLDDLHVTSDGMVWGLSASGAAIRVGEEGTTVFPLRRPGRGLTSWSGIGGAGDRVMVWGAGALLGFDGKAFVPFRPDAELDESEHVAALCAHDRELAMLVRGDQMGAVARFDGSRWLPIPENHVIKRSLADLDRWRGVSILLESNGRVWRIEDGPPRPVIWDNEHHAFLTESGAPRATHSVRAHDGGALLASDGGVIVVGSEDPVFFSAQKAGESHEKVRLSRVGGATGAADSGVVATCGAHAWIWIRDAFHVLDLREW